MFRDSSLSTASDAQLNRLIRRVGVLLVVATIAFVGFYVLDRWKPPAPSIVSQEVLRLEEAIKAAPEDIAVRGRLADAYAVAGRYEDAITQYSLILETGASEQLAHFGRARAYRALEDFDAATADFLAVVEIAKAGEMAHVDPLLNASYYGLGEIALAQGKPEAAVDPLLRAVAIKRSDADALHLLGTAYVRSGEPAKAIAPLKAAIAFVPLGWTEPYATLGDAYTATSRPELAEWAYAMAELSDARPDAAEARLLTITEGPAAVDAAIGLGLVYETRGDGPTAAGWYERALALDADNAAARLGLGRVTAPTAVPSLPSLPKPGSGTEGAGS